MSVCVDLSVLCVCVCGYICLCCVSVCVDISVSAVCLCVWIYLSLLCVCVCGSICLCCVSVCASHGLQRQIDPHSHAQRQRRVPMHAHTIGYSQTQTRARTLVPKCIRKHPDTQGHVLRRTSSPHTAQCCSRWSCVVGSSHWQVSSSLRMRSDRSHT